VLLMRHLPGERWCEQLLPDDATEGPKGSLPRLGWQLLPEAAQRQTGGWAVLGRGGSGRFRVERMRHLREGLLDASGWSNRRASTTLAAQLWAARRHP